MISRARQRLFLRLALGLAILTLVDGCLEFALAGAAHQLTLAIVMFLLIAIARWWWRRLDKAATPFIPPQSESK